MPRRLIFALPIAVLATAAPPAVAAHASAARSCSVAGQERKLGPTYVISLQVTHVSCASGKRLVKSYYRCRVRNGGKRGRCTTRVRGYRCSEQRLHVIETQYDARVTCRKGAARVKHTYTQNT
jgi:hypothetical protein